MKEIKQMLIFYGIQMPNQINSYTWFLLMKELAKKWNESKENLNDLEMRYFLDKCKCKSVCCNDCDDLEYCNDNCYTKSFDCPDCAKKDF